MARLGRMVDLVPMADRDAHADWSSQDSEDSSNRVIVEGNADVHGGMRSTSSAALAAIRRPQQLGKKPRR